MEQQTTTIIEINGVKMAVDMRTAKTVRVDSFQIGSRVKVLRKSGYSGEHQVNVGVIVGFDDFKKLPSIRIAYLKTGYSETPIEFMTFNAETKDAELLLADDDDLSFDRATITAALTSNIEQKRIELEKAECTERLFHKHFGEVVSLAEPAEA